MTGTALPGTVVIMRPRHPLAGRELRVLGGMRRHGRLELLVVLPAGLAAGDRLTLTASAGVVIARRDPERHGDHACQALHRDPGRAAPPVRAAGW